MAKQNIWLQDTDDFNDYFEIKLQQYKKKEQESIFLKGNTQCSDFKYQLIHTLAAKKPEIVREQNCQKIYQCRDCKMIFKTENGWKNHRLNHAKDGSFKCQKCNSTFQIFQDLQKHKITHNRSEYKCEICQKMLINHRQLREHVNDHKDVSSMTCQICSKLFYYKDLLEKHQKIHLDETFKCGICSKVCMSQYQLKVHKRGHSTKGEIRCELCYNLFDTFPELNKHINIHKNDCVECKVCFKLFKTQQQLQLHIEMHQNLSPQQCQFCQKSFKKKKCKIQHELNHRKKLMAAGRLSLE